MWQRRCCCITRRWIVCLRFALYCANVFFFLLDGLRWHKASKDLNYVIVFASISFVYHFVYNEHCDQGDHPWRHPSVLLKQKKTKKGINCLVAPMFVSSHDHSLLTCTTTHQFHYRTWFKSTERHNNQVWGWWVGDWSFPKKKKKLRDDAKWVE